MRIESECGHHFETSEISGEHRQAWEAELQRLTQFMPGTSGATFDCECGELCILVVSESGVYARKFHAYMHEQNSDWPVDGENTFYAEF